MTRPTNHTLPFCKQTNQKTPQAWVVSWTGTDTRTQAARKLSRNLTTKRLPFASARQTPFSPSCAGPPPSTLTMASKLTPFLFRPCLRAGSRVARPQTRALSMTACRASDSLMVVRAMFLRPSLVIQLKNQRLSKSCQPIGLRGGRHNRDWSRKA